jgi:hypothetical protein
LLIGNVVTAILKNQTTDLQLALGFLLRDSKAILGYTYDFGITCSYDEVLRFKKSAAVAAQKDQEVLGISDAKKGLVQVVADNFDAEISSPNGKQTTHALAMIMLQPSSESEIQVEECIPRLKFDERTRPLIAEAVMDNIPSDFVFQKNPQMNKIPAGRLPEDFVMRQNVSAKRASQLDFQFLQAISSDDKCSTHKFNGFNTKVARDQGFMLQPKTKVIYLPMIDKSPTDPDTIVSAMLKAKQVTEATGQQYIVFTADQQLYKVAVQIFFLSFVHHPVRRHAPANELYW